MLELIDLHKRYGDVVALDGCSLRVERGRMVGFLGPNGAGKTTAMRAIFGLVRLDRGRVEWRGAEIGPGDRLRFGYMPEERGLYPRMRVHDQLRYFGEIHGMSGGEASRAAGDWLGRLGLEDRADELVERLSHGNQQRVQLAVALLHRPDLLVLDEPFSGLDPIAVSMLGTLIREEAARGAAVVFSSHQLDLVEDLCDDVSIVSAGRVVLGGVLRDVRAHSSYRYAQFELLAADRSVPLDLTEALEGNGAVEPVWRRGYEARVRVPRDADPQALVAALRQHGELGYFRFEPPALSDLFMEAVGS